MTDIVHNVLLDDLRSRRKNAAELAVEFRAKAASVKFADLAREYRKSATEADETVAQLDGRIAELEEQDRREARAAAVRVEAGGGGHYSPARTSGREVYGPSEPHSYFRDMVNAKRGDWAAAERLNVNNDVYARETRSGDMNTTAGTGGTFAPPLWLVEDFVALARPHRVAANLVTRDNLPNGISSINLPKVASGATVATQSSQNAAVSDTAMTTTSVSSSITTVAGAQIVSLQLVEQSGVPFDRVILGDLAAAYAAELDRQVINGLGTGGELRGLLNAAGVGSTTFTTTQPSFTSSTASNSWYNKFLAAQASVANTRYAPATAVLVSATRWAWIQQAIDSQARPMIVPTAGGSSYNSPGVSTEVIAEGSVGTLGGIPVYVDTQVPVNAGSSTNEDRTIILRAPDVLLYEQNGGVPRLESFTEPFADQLSILYRCVGFAGMIPDRYGASINYMAGTGCISPTL